MINYLFLNFWLIKNSKNDIYESLINDFTKILPWLILLFLNIIFSVLYFKKRIQISQSLYLYPMIFMFFQFMNLRRIPDSYFWNTIPDARTYRNLGETLYSCGKLSLDCNGESFLQWPVGQPLISGVLSMFFYNYAKYIYCFIFCVSIYLVLKISKRKF